MQETNTFKIGKSYKILSFHGSFLSIDKFSEKKSSGNAEKSPIDRDLYAISLGEDKGVNVFVIKSKNNEIFHINVDSHFRETEFIFVNAQYDEINNSYSIQDKLSGFYFSATHKNETIVNRELIGKWEIFKFIELDEEDLFSKSYIDLYNHAINSEKLHYENNSFDESWRILRVLLACAPEKAIDYFNELPEVMIEAARAALSDDIWLGNPGNRDLGLPEKRLAPVDISGTKYHFLANTGSKGSFVAETQALAALRRMKRKPTREVCLLATMRNEGLYIIDWLAYYYALGVDHAFIYTNDNVDGSDALLRALHDAGVITLFYNNVPVGSAPQYKAYGYAFGVDEGILDYQWVLNVDTDEFLVLDSKKYSDIKAFLGQARFAQADAVAFDWLMFGANHQVAWRDEPVWDRFVTRLPLSSTNVKCAMRPQRITGAQCHFPRSNILADLVYLRANGDIHIGSGHGSIQLAFVEHADDSEAWINHYWYKSAQEYLFRRAKTLGGNAFSEANQIEHDLVRRFLIDWDAEYIEDRRLITSQEFYDLKIKFSNLPGIAELFQKTVAGYKFDLKHLIAQCAASPDEEIRFFSEICRRVEIA